MGDNIESLFVICVRRASFLYNSSTLSQLLPTKLARIVKSFQSDVLLLERNIPVSSYSAQIPRHCFLMNIETKKLDLERTVLLIEPHIPPADFFELCACYGLDEPTERVYGCLSREQCELLLQHNAACRCRIMELSQRSSLLYYDEIALECASSGHLQPLERSLMRINVLDDTLLPKCVLRAIDNNHYHIANHIVCDNFEKAFYSLFPDGHVPAEFFVKLIEPQDALVQGEQIATALLRYLPTLDVQRLRRLIQNEPKIRKSVLIRFDAMYSEIIDTRNYPCDYD